MLFAFMDQIPDKLNSRTNVFLIVELVIEGVEFMVVLFADCLSQDAYRPSALFEKFNIKAISTTEIATVDLRWHQIIRDIDWTGWVITAYRPDVIVDPEFAGFAINIEKMGDMAGKDATTWVGYPAALRNRRAFSKHSTRLGLIMFIPRPGLKIWLKISPQPCLTANRVRSKFFKKPCHLMV